MPTPLRLSLKTLRAFAATVERGSISAAASELNVAASAVSASLDQVEAEFGATLLIRTRARGIVPTAEAREMATQFRALLEQYDAVLDRGHAIGQKMSGTLRLGYYAPVAPAFLPSVLGQFLEHAPHLNVTLHAHDNDSAQDGLLRGELDVILFAGQDLRSGITTSHLLDLPPYLLTAIDHPLALRPHVTLAEVAREKLILLDRPLARPYVEGLFRAEGAAPQISAHADSVEMVRALVGARAGVALLSMRPLTDISYGGDKLACTPLSPGLPSLQLLSGHATKQPRQVVTRFLAALEEWMHTPAAKSLIVD